ncbi:MAG: DUF885 family protein, partial [Anaerolineae bacterium]
PTVVLTATAPPATAPPPPTAEPTSDPASIDGILARLEGLPLPIFLEASYKALLLRSPETVTAYGLSEAYGVRDDRLDDLSDAYLRDTQALEAGVLDLLRDYDRQTLVPAEQLSYDVYRWYLETQVAGHPFLYYDYPLNHFIGSYQFELDQLFTELHPLDDAEDVEDYIARLRQVNGQVDQLLAGLKRREALGAIPPDFIVDMTRTDLTRRLQMRSPDPSAIKADDLPVYTHLAAKLEQMGGVSADQEQAYLASAREAIEASWIPAFVRLLDYLGELRALATEDAGVWKLPDGEAYYAYLLRRETSTDLTADEIHQIGLDEVARVRAEMQAVFAELGYPADLTLSEAMDRAMDEAGYFNTSTRAGKEQVIAAYEEMLAEAGRRLDRLVGLKPEGEVVVVGDESFGGGGGFYVPPSADGSRPGAFHTGVGGSWVPKYRMPTIAYHEAVPGHHFQLAISQELELPTFRRQYVVNGYAEGWALYAERLAWELGLYEDDPYGNLGRLDMELLRAVRLVTDTGIHSLGWTRDQAVDYMMEATGDPMGRHTHEVDRYVVLPAQATGYMVGMLKILELRQLATDQLGDDFDMKAFHDLVLGNGTLPLTILERLVRDHLEAKAGSQGQGGELQVPAAYATIQSAIEAATTGDVIVIAPGTYRENIDFTGKAITVRSSDPEDPEVVATTVIDGGGQGAVVTFRSGETVRAVLTGLTITGGAGKAYGDESEGQEQICRGSVFATNEDPRFCGGGIVVWGSWPTIESNVITGNKVRHGGGGLLVASSAFPTIRGNTIAGNEASAGGAIFVIDDSWPKIEGNIIRDNEAAQFGGGIVVELFSAPVIEGNTMSGNWSGTGGGALVVFGYGGATIRGNTIVENETAQSGGALFLGATSESTLQDNVIRANEAILGGAIYCELGSILKLQGNTLEANNASFGGGALDLGGCSVQLAGNSFLGNVAPYGGAIHDTGNPDLVLEGNEFVENRADFGGALQHVGTTEANLERNQFRGNIATQGGAIWALDRSKLTFPAPDDNVYEGNQPDDLYISPDSDPYPELQDP